MDQTSLSRAAIWRPGPSASEWVAVRWAACRVCL